jgi:hypothetical protein
MVENSIGGGPERQLSPEQRTEAFFAQDAMDLAETMNGRIIASLETGNKIIVNSAQGYTREENNTSRYTKGQLNLLELPPGTLGVFPYPFRRTKLSLIAARSGEDTGGCVRISKASRFSRDNQAYIPLQREREVAESLGLDDWGAVRLRFVDDSEVLYFDSSPVATKESVDPEAADQYLEDLVEK